MKYQYSVKEIKENSAKAYGRDLPISKKQSIEICNYIRGNSVAIAKRKLEAAIAQKEAIPFKRFTDGVGHKSGNLTSGRYAVKASQNILKLINSAESNAINKGLNAKGLVIVHLAVQQAPQAWHYGRRPRRQMKRCHVELVVEEQKLAEKKLTKKTQAPKSEQKPAEVPKAQAKPEVKPEVKTETKPEVKAENKPAATPAQKEVKPEAKQEAKPAEKAEPKAESKPEVKATEAPKENTPATEATKKPEEQK